MTKAASDLLIGDKVEGHGTVIAITKRTAKTLTARYECFPEYVALNGVRRESTRHKLDTQLALRG